MKILNPKEVLPLRVKVDLGVMSMKENSILSRPPELEPHNHMKFKFRVIPRPYRRF